MKVVLAFVGVLLALAAPARAHSIIEFERAVPAVGSVTDAKVSRVVLYFRTEYDSHDVNIRVDKGGKNIPFRILTMTHSTVIVAETKSPLRPGIYNVSWKISDHHQADETWHTYNFTVSDRQPLS